ncbi:MAG: CDC48 family AAA ATPase [Candidatus Woesearchaeota archaeon]|jgi:transitional endoplasmic reticulum ATPase|nr:CDC48 family AAA ATPase [Candidatus Woesearchaeota archaeon]
MDNKVKLNVAETYHEDIGRGIVRVEPDILDRLGISNGDYLLIRGKSETIAKAMGCNSEDFGLNLIRMDSSLRSNVGVGLGDDVDVARVSVVEAKSIEISPTEEVKFTGDPSKIFLEKMVGKPLVKGNVLYFNIMGTTLHYVVTKTSPKKYVRITGKTKLNISDKVVKPGDLKVPTVTYDDIGGLKEEVSAIREMIEIPMKHPEVFERIGISPPKGVLLYGPPGTGKTLLAKALAYELDAHFKVINGPEIMSKFYGESEKHLRDIFDEAEKNSPAIIFIDEIDSIAPNRDNVTGEAERRIVSQMLTLMDGLKGRGNVVVIAATNRQNSIDPALRRPGRFDREIAINPPNREGRRQILDVHARGMPLVKKEDVSREGKIFDTDIVDLDKISEVTHGFTGADLEVLTKEAAMKALKTWIPDLIKTEHQIPTNVLESIKIKMSHFNEALNKVEPSAMREVLIRKPNVKWDSIGGLEDAKRDLKEMVEMPLREPEVFREAGIKAPKGILLSGPSGTGKTLLAKAVATESEANFISVKGPELVSKWVGESEKAVREIFKKAKQVAPCVIFFDEFDSIASARGGSNNDSADKIVNQLLTELDGIEELTGVSIIAATNRADLIDDALKRPGRLDSIIEIGLPDEKTREAIFKIHTKNMPLFKDVKIIELAKLTDKFSGAEIEGVCQKAGLFAIRERKSKEERIDVFNKYFDLAIKEIKSRKN